MKTIQELIDTHGRTITQARLDAFRTPATRGGLRGIVFGELLPDYQNLLKAIHEDGGEIQIRTMMGWEPIDHPVWSPHMAYAPTDDYELSEPEPEGEIEQLRATNRRLQAALATPECYAGVVTNVVEKDRDAAIKRAETAEAKLRRIQEFVEGSYPGLLAEGVRRVKDADAGDVGVNYIFELAAHIELMCTDEAARKEQKGE